MKTESCRAMQRDRLSFLAALVLLVLYLLAGRAAQAGEEPGEGAITRGSLLLQTQAGAIPAPTLHTDVQMEVSGLLARVKVRQRFRNPGNDWAEAVYVFPLPEQAAVDHLRMQIGERIIEGQIQEKAQAKKTYEQAKQAGQRASLVEQERPNIFTTSVANIGPGEDISVEIEYQQTLHYADGEFRLRFPMVVGPRYIPGTPLAAADRIASFSGDGWAQDTDQVPDAARITPPVQPPGADPINPVSLAIELDAGFPLASVTSPFHAIQQQDRGARRRHIELAAGEVPADRDFELVWRPLPGSEPTAAWFSQQHAGKDYGMLMLMPPVELAAPPVVAREVVFVIDTSGSMHGDSITQARQALVLALGRLKPADRFNIIQFNHTAHALFNGPQSAVAERVRLAQDYVRSLQAEGGTEMLPALQMALPQEEETGGRLRQVVFLTDGSVGNEAALFAAIQRGLGSSRLFTIGIGSAPNSYFMRKAAEYGRGTFTYIGDTAEVASRMQALFRKLESPALTDIRLETTGGVALEVYPRRIPDLYLGEPLLLVMRGEQMPTAVTLKGTFGATPWHSELQLKGGGERSLAPEWARRRIEDLLGQRREAADDASRDALRQEALDTALQHHLVSEFTSLVAVDVTPARTREQLLQRHALKTNLPKGWSHAHVFGTAKTATPAQLQLLIGLLLLAMAAGLGWRRRHAAG